MPRPTDESLSVVGDGDACLELQTLGQAYVRDMRRGLRMFRRAHVQEGRCRRSLRRQERG